ncbi:fibronectin type III domain-containing protein [Luteolibacter sp. GHJ8]|uniref:Fibronectin type III domain-containing protein n=1 Tax=Luteolibacter rhizosphaerae TaxID=2989719 RepID=A0ABT3FY48_9BACT|nr:fibronectin type III domain-containing protein [Luteolibacter rhizosphaerae]MCW1912505.1 fibronectin type III domain-containing protein [Luteolibacter rhizosphaerae]
MKRSDFLRLSAFGGIGLAARGIALPEGYTGIPAGIRPYLQTPRPDSMWVSWFSDNAPEGQIEWGTSAGNLSNTITAQLDVLGSGYHYHAGRITGLSPSSYYYYRVRNGSTVSATFRFRTPPPAGTKTGKLRVLVMGDNQIIAENRYEKLIACAKAKIEADYGLPIEEVIDFILMPGDQVDVGTLDHYRNLHFKQCGLISPNIPIMTTVGNHETYYDSSLSLYSRIFRYDDISYANLPGPEGEKYYAYQLANVAFIHSSSEHTGNTQKQWLRSLVDALKTDASTDLCVSVVHRPYQAEQYVGDISGWFRSEIMPMLAETPKHVLNIGAHHHLYARGQTREWPIYHIISGGTAWDQYWGQSSEIDFDDVQKTIAHWAWQLLDFDLAAQTMQATCYAEANVKLPAATRWNYNSRVIDSFHRKLGLPAPQKPSLTNTFTGPVTLPLELVSSPYQTASGEAINSTWFQVAADNGFTNLKIDRIRDVENLYGDTGAPLYEPVNIHAGIDILRYNAAAGLFNGSYHARVRHRDANAMWSPWSDAVSFTVEGSTGGPTAIKLAKTVYPVNEDILVTYENGPGLPKDWIGIYRKGQTPGSGTGTSTSTTWSYVDAANPVNGTRNLNYNLPVGEWFAAFFTNDGYTEVAPRVSFYVGNKVTLTPSEQAYDEGETVSVDFANAPAGAKDWIGVYRVDQNPGAATPSVQWGYATTAAGTRTFANLPKGYYYATFCLNDGYQEIADRVRFSVGTQITTVSMASATVPAGEDFSVNFSNGPGIPKDWIGLFKQGDVPGVDILTAYLYFAGASSGSVTFQLPDLPPGDYFVAMFTNDSYTEVSNRFLFSVLPAEKIELESCEMESDQMRFRWKSVPGRAYKIQRSTGLSSWTDIRTVVASGSSHEELVSIDRFTDTRCYFRVTDD